MRSNSYADPRTLAKPGEQASTPAQTFPQGWRAHALYLKWQRIIRSRRDECCRFESCQRTNTQPNQGGAVRLPTVPTPPALGTGQPVRVATTNGGDNVAGDGQTSRRYRQLRKTYRAQCEQANTPCWLCSQPINYTIPWPDEQSFELDHLHPRSTHPQHAEDPANFRASHRACNNKRGNKTPTANLGTLNRQWLKG